MATGQDIFRSLLIIVFASALVALGAQDLYQRYGKRQGGSLEDRKWQMLEQLRGPDIKAQMSPERIDRARSQRRAGSGSASTPEEERASSKQDDSLTHGDRLELDRLLNTLTP